MRGGAFLNGKEGRVGFRKKPFLMGKSCANERNKVHFQIAECSPLYQKKKDGVILEKT